MYTKNELKRMLASAQKAQAKINEITSKIFNEFHTAGINLDECPTTHSNANTIAEAILCLIAYDEGDENVIIDEMLAAYNRKSKISQNT